MIKCLLYNIISSSSNNVGLKYIVTYRDLLCSPILLLGSTAQKLTASVLHQSSTLLDFKLFYALLHHILSDYYATKENLRIVINFLTKQSLPERTSHHMFHVLCFLNAYFYKNIFLNPIMTLCIHHYYMQIYRK